MVDMLAKREVEFWLTCKRFVVNRAHYRYLGSPGEEEEEEEEEEDRKREDSFFRYYSSVKWHFSIFIKRVSRRLHMSERMLIK